MLYQKDDHIQVSILAFIATLSSHSSQATPWAGLRQTTHLSGESCNSSSSVVLEPGPFGGDQSLGLSQSVSMDDSEGDAHDLSAYTEPPSESNSLLDLMAGIV